MVNAIKRLQANDRCSRCGEISNSLRDVSGSTLLGADRSSVLWCGPCRTDIVNVCGCGRPLLPCLDENGKQLGVTHTQEDDDWHLRLFSGARFGDT